MKPELYRFDKDGNLLKRRCCLCKKFKYIHLFAKRRTGTGFFGIYPRCKACRKNVEGPISKERQRTKRIWVRNQIIEHYGGKCACCGERQYEFLCIDHKNNDGAKQRKDLGLMVNGRSYSSATFYRWIIDNNYPKDLQILCHNCNLAKGFYGECPHVKQKCPTQ